MYCPNCGSEMAAGMMVCQSCGWREASPKIEDDPAMRLLLPVGHSVMAIVSSYLGLFSVLVLPAPFALITGIVALNDLKKHPEKSGKGRAMFGLVMGAIFCILPVILVIVSVAAN